MKETKKNLILYKAASMIYYGILLDSAPGNVLLGNAIVGFLSFVAGPIICLWMKFGTSDRRKIMIILYITTASLVLIMGKHYLLTSALSVFENFKLILC